MEQSHLRRMALGVALLIVTIAASASVPQTVSKAQKSAGHRKGALVNAKQGGDRGSIKVHGHWVIEVHNPDGTFVSHTEFENSFQGGLSNFLSRQAPIPGLWRIRLEGSPAPGPCFGDCFIIEPNAPPAEFGSRNLTVATVNGSFVLSGTATILAQQSSINAVATYSQNCSYGDDPAKGLCSGYGPFTKSVLTAPVNVTVGQVVKVTVTISFS
jgi:hypothetical protein